MSSNEAIATAPPSRASFGFQGRRNRQAASRVLSRYLATPHAGMCAARRRRGWPGAAGRSPGHRCSLLPGRAKAEPNQRAARASAQQCLKPRRRARQHGRLRARCGIGHREHKSSRSWLPTGQVDQIGRLRLPRLYRDR
eukprot:4279545-Prymnesium_polylepis.1